MLGTVTGDEAEDEEGSRRRREIRLQTYIEKEDATVIVAARVVVISADCEKTVAGLREALWTYARTRTGDGFGWARHGTPNVVYEIACGLYASEGWDDHRGTTELTDALMELGIRRRHNNAVEPDIVTEIARARIDTFLTARRASPDGIVRMCAIFLMRTLPTLAECTLSAGTVASTHSAVACMRVAVAHISEGAGSSATMAVAISAMALCCWTCDRYAWGTISPTVCDGPIPHRWSANDGVRGRVWHPSTATEEDYSGRVSEVGEHERIVGTVLLCLQTIAVCLRCRDSCTRTNGLAYHAISAVGRALEAVADGCHLLTGERSDDFRRLEALRSVAKGVVDLATEICMRLVSSNTASKGGDDEDVGITEAVDALATLIPIPTRKRDPIPRPGDCAEWNRRAKECWPMASEALLRMEIPTTEASTTSGGGNATTAKGKSEIRRSAISTLGPRSVLADVLSMWDTQTRDGHVTEDGKLGGRKTAAALIKWMGLCAAVCSHAETRSGSRGTSRTWLGVDSVDHGVLDVSDPYGTGGRCARSATKKAGDLDAVLVSEILTAATLRCTARVSDATDPDFRRSLESDVVAALLGDGRRKDRWWKETCLAGPLSAYGMLPCSTGLTGLDSIAGEIAAGRMLAGVPRCVAFISDTIGPASTFDVTGVPTDVAEELCGGWKILEDEVVPDSTPTETGRTSGEATLNVKATATATKNKVINKPGWADRFINATARLFGNGEDDEDEELGIVRSDSKIPLDVIAAETAAELGLRSPAFRWMVDPDDERRRLWLRDAVAVETAKRFVGACRLGSVPWESLANRVGEDVPKTGMWGIVGFALACTTCLYEAAKDDGGGGTVVRQKWGHALISFEELARDTEPRMRRALCAIGVAAFLRIGRIDATGDAADAAFLASLARVHGPEYGEREARWYGTTWSQWLRSRHRSEESGGGGGQDVSENDRWRADAKRPCFSPYRQQAQNNSTNSLVDRYLQNAEVAATAAIEFMTAATYRFDYQPDDGLVAVIDETIVRMLGVYGNSSSGWYAAASCLVELRARVWTQTLLHRRRDRQVSATMTTTTAIPWKARLLTAAETLHGRKDFTDAGAFYAQRSKTFGSMMVSVCRAAGTAIELALIATVRTRGGVGGDDEMGLTAGDLIETATRLVSVVGEMAKTADESQPVTSHRGPFEAEVAVSSVFAACSLVFDSSVTPWMFADIPDTRAEARSTCQLSDRTKRTLVDAAKKILNACRGTDSAAVARAGDAIEQWARSGGKTS